MDWEITVKAWEPDEENTLTPPKMKQEPPICYIPVISSRYDMDTDAELPMIFIEITDAVIIYRFRHGICL